ncbi:MAG: aminopeptidase P family protein [Chloroflexi bacterium]|nr:aminopeptidase P family protein [Chloroflexota bacterium]
MNERVTRLRAILADTHLDAFLVTQPENRRYLSGFSGSAGVLIITPEEALLATDFRYYEQVRQQAPDFTLVEVTDKTPPVLAERLAALGARRVGMESQDLTVDIYSQWQEAMPNIEWVPLTGVVEGLREVKDADELATIEEAVRIADRAMEHIYDWIRPGVTEQEVAWELEVHMRTHGAERLSFNTIVAAGPRGAMSHAVPTERPIGRGEPIVIDMGALYDGYCSDLTRSFCIGEATDEYLRIWDTVLRAQRTAEEGIRGGMIGSEADALARDLIYGEGFEGKFGHGLGHGVGLAIHEGPRAARTATGALRPGAIVTVEPGIYDPAWGGIRIEDMVVITEDGCRVLTGVARRPVVGK